MATEIAKLTDRLLSDVATRKSLSPEEEARLARLVAEGEKAAKRLEEPGVPAAERQRLEELARNGREAMTELIAHNLPLLVRMTRRELTRASFTYASADRLRGTFVPSTLPRTATVEPIPG